MNEDVTTIIEEVGISEVLTAVKESYNFYKNGHKYRKEMCLKAQATLDTLIAELDAVEAKHGYTPGQAS